MLNDAWTRDKMVAMFVLMTLGVMLLRAVHLTPVQKTLCKRRDARPVTLVHVPKTGTGFQRYFLRHACDVKTQEEIQVLGTNATVFGHHVLAFLKSHNASCQVASWGGGHKPLREHKVEGKRVLMMMREPIARIASGFLHNLHDCVPMKEHYKCAPWRDGYQDECTVRLWQQSDHKRKKLLQTYAECVSACATNMLLGRACASHEWSHGDGSDVQDAIRVMQEKVAFVGITDQWAASVDVFCGLYGLRDCDAAAHVRESPNKTWHRQVEQMLREMAFVAHDEPLYKESLRTFDRLKMIWSARKEMCV